MAVPPLCFLKNVSLSFGGKPLFQSIDLQVYAHDRICLVGRNGCGKSTLLKIIAATLEYDHGERFLQPGTSIGYLAQTVAFNPNQTVYTYVLEELAKAEEVPLESLQYQADQVLYPLQLEGVVQMGNLSGGNLRKAALARALLTQPKLLLLDEPTNHLDIATIEWLQNYLLSYPGGIVCISHDRAFLATISNKMWWMDRGTLRTYGKGFAHFDEWEESLIQQELQHMQKIEKQLEREEHWLVYGVSARRKRNVQRLGALHALRQKAKSDQARITLAKNSVELPPLPAHYKSKLIFELENVSFEYKQGEYAKKIIQNLSLRVLKGEKIALMGKNGIGKSTLLKLLVGQYEPTQGRIRRGNHLTISYFDQQRDALDPDKSLWETLCPDGGDHIFLGERSRHVVAYLKDFLFDPKQAHAKVATLSGGEANRLLLAKILANPGGILILDEPTNDLDMDTLDMLQETLSNYEGTLLLVSHDRDFVDRVATRTFMFESEGVIVDLIGGYSDYIEQRGTLIATPASAKQEQKKSSPEEKRNNGPVKLSYNQKRLLEILPQEIEALTLTIQQVEGQLADPALYEGAPELFSKLAEELSIKKSLLWEKENQWLELEELRLSIEEGLK